MNPTLLSLIRAGALQVYNAGYRLGQGTRSGLRTGLAALENRFRNIPDRLLNQVADIAAEARRAASNWNRSSRGDYVPNLETIPDISARQRREGLRGPTVLEYRYRFAYCFYDEDGTEVRREWVTESQRVGLRTTAQELILGSLDKAAADEAALSGFPRNARYRQQSGELRVERCDMQIDSIIRMIDA